jgi:sodium-coupled monocarboxylate transporter 8/12
MEAHETEPANFSVWDYVVFGAILAISAGIGLFHACTGGKQKTKDEFLLAGKAMSSLPVALSVLASFFSASTLLGTPAEVYQQGITYWLSVFGAVLAPAVGAYLFGPFFHRMQLISVFEVG